MWVYRIFRMESFLFNQYVVSVKKRDELRVICPDRREHGDILSVASAPAKML